jgi:hypothetical protein
VRRSIPGLERAVEARKAEIAAHEAWLVELGEMPSGFVTEHTSPPDDTRHLAAQDADCIRARRMDLSSAIAALGGDYAQGTLVDHLWNKPRIPGTRRRIEDAREALV